MERAYTATQGQYLVFIYYYTKLHGVPPAEADMQRYFRVSPPSVHNMIITLEKRRLIERSPGAGLSIQLLLGRDQLPDLTCASCPSSTNVTEKIRLPISASRNSLQTLKITSSQKWRPDVRSDS